MGIIRPLKLGLFIYECFKIFLLVAAFMALRPIEPTSFPWLIFAAPSALYPLMALFLWLDVVRYRNYLPLFAAGKCIGIMALLGWFIVSRQGTMIDDFSGRIVLIELILLSGDLFATAAVLLIIRNVPNATKTPVSDQRSVEDMEEK